MTLPRDRFVHRGSTPVPNVANPPAPRNSAPIVKAMAPKGDVDAPIDGAPHHSFAPAYAWRPRGWRTSSATPVKMRTVGQNRFQLSQGASPMLLASSRMPSTTSTDPASR